MNEGAVSRGESKREIREKSRGYSGNVARALVRKFEDPCGASSIKNRLRALYSRISRKNLAALDLSFSQNLYSQPSNPIEDLVNAMSFLLYMRLKQVVRELPVRLEKVREVLHYVENVELYACDYLQFLEVTEQGVALKPTFNLIRRTVDGLISDHFAPEVLASHNF